MSLQKKKAIALPSERVKPRYIGRYHRINDKTLINKTYPPAAPVSALVRELETLYHSSQAYPPWDDPATRSRIHPTKLTTSVTIKANHWKYRNFVTC